MIQVDPGLIQGDPWLIRLGPGWSLACSGPDVLKYLIQPALAPDWLPDEPSGTHPRVLWDSTVAHPWNVDHGEPWSSPGWVPVNSRMTPGLLPEESRTNTDDLRMNTDDPEESRMTYGWTRISHGWSRFSPGITGWAPDNSRKSQGWGPD